MDTSALQRWLQLSLARRFDAAQLKTLRAAASVEVLQAFSPDNFAALGLPDSAWPWFAQWQRGQITADVQRWVAAALDWCDGQSRHLVTWGDPRYPALLATCSDAPPQLFVHGDVATLALPQLAIVGSRRPTPDGRRHARRFAADLVACGYQITSGLALGIDAEGHAGALDAGGSTIAVLGTGPDVVHPRANAALAERVVQHGALVSEFPPGTRAEPWHFPARNRIISGLTHGVLVVEAAEQSGSLITARLAGAQGREVFAIPGSINNPMARGCHRLLRQGAKLVERIDDILEEVPALVAWERRHDDDAVAAQANAAEAALPAPVRALWAQVGYDPQSLDALLLRCGMPVNELLPLLTQLELQGLVELRPQGYVRSSSTRL